MRLLAPIAIGAAGAALSLISAPPLHAAADKDRKAPSITLKNLDGRRVKLADRRGRVVVIDFWASWCAPCKATFPALNALGEEIKNRGIDVLAVSEDEKRKDLDAFLAAFRPSIEVLTDASGDAADAFGVTAIPSMYVIDTGGIIRFAHPGYGAEVIDLVKGEAVSLTSSQFPTPNSHLPISNFQVPSSKPWGMGVGSWKLGSWRSYFTSKSISCIARLTLPVLPGYVVAAATCST